MSVNARVKEVREFLGLSQAKFAERLHISSSYISSLENENRIVNPRIIRLICSSYGVNEMWMKTGAFSMYDQESNARVEQVIQLFKDLCPASQKHLLKLIEGLLEMQNIEAEAYVAGTQQKN